MNKQLSPLWTHLTSESRLTGTWRDAFPNYQNQPSPCLGACPVNGRIAEWIKQVKHGDLSGAWATLTDNNPFPAIAGRICHHPCETACNRAEHDETVGICSLERFVGDTAIAEGWGFTPGEDRRQSVAIIGGGPAGLSAAYQLRKYGIQVSLYEAKDNLGGLMRYGIPSYRLGRDVLNQEIDRIVSMGLDLHLGAEVMDQVALASLRKTHDAIFLATGASLPKRVPTLDYEQSWVVDSVDFLAGSVETQKAQAGAAVVVIGGGSAAMDVARSARRLGCAVTVLSLEPEGRLPAQQIEITEAAEEGIRFVSGAMIQAASSGSQNVTLQCINVEFTLGDTPGSFSANPLVGSEFTLTADTIIPAIGQDADLDRWQDRGGGDSPVLRIGQDWQTNTLGVFAGGDVASMSRFVTHAIGMGKDAAHTIAASLLGAEKSPAFESDQLVPIDRINIAYQEKHERAHQGVTSPDKRLEGFDEVQLPLKAAEAVKEAARCFSCGTCILCDNCFYYCPDMAILRVDGGYKIKADYCKGCGLCVAECPTGSIHMQEDTTP